MAEFVALAGVVKVIVSCDFVRSGESDNWARFPFGGVGGVDGLPPFGEYITEEGFTIVVPVAVESVLAVKLAGNVPFGF
jgi:hypothetical protein